MRHLPFLFRLMLLAFLLHATSISATAQDPVDQAQMWAKEAKDQLEKARDAAGKLDCEKPKSRDKKALVDAVRKANDAAKNAEKWAGIAKTNAENAQIALDKSPKSKSAQTAKDEADKAAMNAGSAAEEARQAARDALEQAPGLAAAAAIEAQLDKADVSNNSKKKEAVERLKKAANAAAEADPCGPEAAEEVKRAVRVELEKLKGELKGNKELSSWMENLGKQLKDNSLIFFQAQDSDALVFTATGTGRTTGHIADLAIFNPTGTALTFAPGPCFIPSAGDYQPYIVPAIPAITVPPHATCNLPIMGYCTDIYLPPVPNGAAFPPASQWIKINPAEQPLTTAAQLLGDLDRIAQAYDDLKAQGALTTPFSGNPEKERESVIQQTLWIHTAAQAGHPYTIAQFRDNTVRQYEAATGIALDKAPAEQQKQVEQGVQDFWGAFQATGVQAKVLVAEEAEEEIIWTPVLEARYQLYVADRKNGNSHEKAMKLQAPTYQKYGKYFQARYKKETGKE